MKNIWQIKVDQIAELLRNPHPESYDQALERIYKNEQFDSAMIEAGIKKATNRREGRQNDSM
jgi:predicted transcriptional regulator